MPNDMPPEQIAEIEARVLAWEFTKNDLLTLIASLRAERKWAEKAEELLKITSSVGGGAIRDLLMERKRADKAESERDAALAGSKNNADWFAQANAERQAAEAEVKRLKEALCNLWIRTKSFWALIQGEHGVRLSSEEHDDHNVYEFFAAMAFAAALSNPQEDVK